MRKDFQAYNDVLQSGHLKEEVIKEYNYRFRRKNGKYAN